MVVALHILQTQLHLCFLELFLPVEHVLEDGEAINDWQNIAQVAILHRLHLVDVERDDFKHFLFESPHVLHGTVVHDVEAVVIRAQEDVVCLINGDLVDAAHDSLRLSLLGVSVLSGFKLG